MYGVITEPQPARQAASRGPEAQDSREPAAVGEKLKAGRH